MDEKRRRAIEAQRDDIEDRLNSFGGGRSDRGKRRPQRPKGNSRAALLRRLRRDHPELHALVLAGGTTPFEAACAAGIRKKPGPRPKQRPVAPLELELSPSQQQELWLGAADSGSAFSSEDERRELWFQHRARLMGMFSTAGTRPVAWWQYESPPELYYPGPDYERSTLFEANLLSESEKAELLAYWLREFSRAWSPGFTVCLGPGRFLAGEPAREAHYRWADIPPMLLEEWSAELLQQKEKAPAATAEGPQECA